MQTYDRDELLYIRGECQMNLDEAEALIKDCEWILSVSDDIEIRETTKQDLETLRNAKGDIMAKIQEIDLLLPFFIPYDRAIGILQQSFRESRLRFIANDLAYGNIPENLIAEQIYSAILSTGCPFSVEDIPLRTGGKIFYIRIPAEVNSILNG